MSLLPLPLRACRKTSRGFTLIEVLVVMLVLGILAAIAIPSYAEYVNRSRRTEAKTALLQIAQWQERRRTEAGGYATAFPTGFTLNTVNTAPGQVTYNITINAGADANSYTLTATRAGLMANDLCGNFTLNHLGVRDAVGGTRPAADCWDR